MTTVVEPNVRVAVSDWLDCAAGTGDVYKVSVSKQNQDKVTLLLKEGPEAWLIQRPGALHDFAVEFKRLDDARDDRLRAPDNAKGHVIWSCKQAGATDVFGDINPRGSNSTTTPKRAPAPAAPTAPRLSKLQELQAEYENSVKSLAAIKDAIAKAHEHEAHMAEYEATVEAAKQAVETERAAENARQREANLKAFAEAVEARKQSDALISALAAKLGMNPDGTPLTPATPPADVQVPEGAAQ